MITNKAVCAPSGLACLDTDAHFAYHHALAHVAGEKASRAIRAHASRTSDVSALDHGSQSTDDVVDVMFSIEKILTRNDAENPAPGLPDELHFLCERLFANLASHRAYLPRVLGPPPAPTRVGPVRQG